MRDKSEHGGGEIPSPTLVAAWLVLNLLPTERVPRWASFWLAGGFDGTALVDLAALRGDDPHEVRDLLPAALTDCGVTVPTSDAAAAMEAFTHLAQCCIDHEAGERWLVGKVDEIVVRTGYATSVIALPLGQLYGLDDEWGRRLGPYRYGTACRDPPSMSGPTTSRSRPLNTCLIDANAQPQAWY